MSRKTTTYKKPIVQALAALVAVLGVGLIGAAPARADVGFSFSFGFPAPFIPVPVYAPPVAYAPPVVVYERPVVVYDRLVYYKHPQGRAHGYWRKHDRDHDRWDRSGYRDARW